MWKRDVLPIATWLLRLWHQAKRWYELILPARFSVLSVALFGIAFVFVPQGQDAVRYLSERGAPMQLWFIVPATLLALAAWYMSRQLLHVDFPNMPAPPPRSWIVTWGPRLLGGAVYGLFAYANYKAAAGWLLVVLHTALAIAFVALTTARRTRLRRRATRRQRSVFHFPKSSLTVIAVGIAGAIVFFVFAWRATIGTGRFFGAPGIVAMSLAVWVVVGGLLAYCGGKMRFPIGGALLLYAFLISPHADNHRIREHGELTPRRTVKQQFDLWKANRKPPYFVVATQGGGIRAAYWTALVLSNLERRSGGEFSKHVFAISGVSGGSLGATVWVTALAAGSHDMDVVDRAFEPDNLGPLLAGMLQTDVVQHVLPFGFQPDRAAVLETAWEDSWRYANQPKPDNRFADSFVATYGNRFDLPSLFLNGTIVENGKRIIASNCDVDNGQFTEAFDGFNAMRKDMRLSTAAHFSARFTYFSPAGSIPNRDPGGKGTPICDHCDTTCCHVVDGGYFENSGAVTGGEIVKLIGDANVARIVIDAGTEPPIHAYRYATELLSPPLALFNTNDARGRMAVTDFMNKPPLRCTLSDSSIPLGWLLSDASRARMRFAAEELRANNDVLKLISGGHP